MSGIEVRQFPMELRQQNRRLTARLASYGREYPVNGFSETLRPGVFKKSLAQSARSLPLMIEHRHERIPVGKAVEWQDTDETLTGHFTFDTRAEATEAARLVDEGMLAGISVGFLPINDRWDRSGRTPHVERIEARLIEASLCSMPVYEDAGVLALRSAGHPEINGLEIVPTPLLNEAREWLASIRRK